jgi:hypothetical protein
MKLDITKPTPSIFPNQPTLSAKDVERLAPHLSGWNRLSEMLVLDTVSNDDLKRLILLETKMTSPRKRVIQKLLARLLSRARHDLTTTISKFL